MNVQPIFGSSRSLNLTGNSLLIGSVDARHILKSASLNTNCKFHVVETQAPLICRQLLLLSIIFNKSLPRDEAIALFLDLYGNTRISQKSFEFLNYSCSDLINLVTNNTGALSNIVSFDKMRFKERDDLEFTFSFWKSTKQFQIDHYWEQLLRTYYAARYDSRENVADWDYSMNISEKASIIHSKEFMKFRIEGVFMVDSIQRTLPNRSMATASNIAINGSTCLKWGYFSDITSGPFYSFGIDCPNAELLKKSNNKHIHTSLEVSECNIDMYITCIPPTPNLHVEFLPCDPTLTLTKYKHRYIDFYDSIFLGNHLAQYLPLTFDLLKSGGKVYVETAYFVANMTNDQVKEFSKRVIEMGKDAGFKLEGDADKDIIVFNKELSS